MLRGHDLSVSLWLTVPLKGNVINLRLSGTGDEGIAPTGGPLPS